LQRRVPYVHDCFIDAVYSDVIVLSEVFPILRPDFAQFARCRLNRSMYHRSEIIDDNDIRPTNAWIAIKSRYPA
jgi:hypothetical protein